MDRTFQVVDDIRFTATGDQDARRSKLVEGVAETGVVSEYVTTSDDPQRRRIVRMRVDATVTVELEPEQLEQAQADVVDELVAKVAEVFAPRFVSGPDAWRGTLFEGTDTSPPDGETLT
jgi:hypothetical protein